MTTGIARDLSAKLQKKLAEVLERELNIFQHVVQPAEISEIMFEAAVLTVRTTAATLAAYANDPKDIEAIFRATTAGILQMVQHGEDAGVARVVAELQARRS